MSSRAAHLRRVWLTSCLSTGVLTTSIVRLGAQSAAAAPPAIRVWAFGRIGPAWSSAKSGNYGARLASGALGIAGSYGAALGMIRTTANADARWLPDSPVPGMQDVAVLIGARSRGDRLFLAGVVGVANATPGGTFSPSGALIRGELAPTFDLSAHADYRVVGGAFALSGVLGPPSIRYVALSIGVELGWLGR